MGHGNDDEPHGFDVPRRGFLAAGAGAFLCTIGGRRVELARPGDAAKADAAAAAVARPRAKAAAAAPGAGPTEQMRFETPQPQPGGTAREYWIQARSVLWRRWQVPASFAPSSSTR